MRHFIPLTPSIIFVIGMWVQLDFINKICSNFEYWSDPAVVAASIHRYQQFMALVFELQKQKKFNKILVPTLDIDLVWHCHQSHPVDYKPYCVRRCGRMIDHDDTLGSGDLERGYARLVY